MKIIHREQLCCLVLKCPNSMEVFGCTLCDMYLDIYKCKKLNNICKIFENKKSIGRILDVDIVRYK